MYNIKSIAENLATIAKIKKSNAELDLVLHDLAMNALHYANQPLIQDVTLAQNLVEALGRSHRKEALITWFKHFGKITTTKIEGKTVLKFTKHNAEYINNNLDKIMAEADEKPFYTAIEKPVDADAFVTIDIKEEVAKLIKRISKIAENDKNVINHLELIADLRDLAASDNEV
jgi:hypothetical protein